jgi:hypothetical protein
MDFSNAPTKQTVSGEVIPKGTLLWATLEVRPHNADMGVYPKPSSKTPGNAYLDCELTVDGGPYEGRKLWEMIGVEGSPKYTEQGAAAIRHILETGKAASPTNPQGYVIETYGELDGLRVALEVSVEKGGPKQDGSGDYPDKNRVARFLSPSPESDTNAKFKMLVAGQQPLPATTTAAAKPAVPAATPAARPAAGTPPAWLKK